MKKTKIICSIGPSSNTFEVFEKMVVAGMNVARINFSHATGEECQTAVDLVKKINQDSKNYVAIMYDTKGPDFRTGSNEKEEIII